MVIISGSKGEKRLLRPSLLISKSNGFLVDL